MFGLLTSLTITTAEFFGRRITNEIGPIVAASAISLVATISTLVVAILAGGDLIGHDLLLGAFSGVAFGVSMTVYLQGLRVSSSAVIAPMVAALTTLIPFTYGSIVEGALPMIGLVGAGAVILGLLFVTMGGSEASNVRQGLLLGTIAGSGYGVGTALLIGVSADSGSWPVVSQRGVSFIAIVAYALVRRRPLVPPRRLAVSAGTSGVFAALSSVLLLVGLNANAPAASVTASLFPASSVVAGRLFFGDSVSRSQVLGLGTVICGTLGIVLA